MTFPMDGALWVYSCHHDQHRIAVPGLTHTYETGGSFEGDIGPSHVERIRLELISR